MTQRRRENKCITKSAAERKADQRERDKFRLHPRCRITRYSAGGEVNGIKLIGKLIAAGIGIESYREMIGDCPVLSERSNPDRFERFSNWVKEHDVQNVCFPINKKHTPDPAYTPSSYLWRRSAEFFTPRVRQPIQIGRTPTFMESWWRWVRLGWDGIWCRPARDRRFVQYYRDALRDLKQRSLPGDDDWMAPTLGTWASVAATGSDDAMAIHTPKEPRIYGRSESLKKEKDIVSQKDQESWIAIRRRKAPLILGWDAMIANMHRQMTEREADGKSLTGWRPGHRSVRHISATYKASIAPRETIKMAA